MTEETTIIESGNISISIPKTWSGIAGSDAIAPKNGTLVMAYKSGEVHGGFSNNIIILKDDLENIITSEKYSTLNHLQTQKNYLEYEPISDAMVSFSDNEVSRVYVFRAKYNETTPLLQYIQTARVCGTRVYLIHFSLAVDKKPDNYIKLLETFTCK